MTDATSTTRVARERLRADILERFRAETPELADALKLAGDAEELVRSFERAQEPMVTYSVTSGTVAT